jgi:shikimate dehydrogenase
MTTFVAVLGHPVGHSRSPAMHNRAFAELGMDWKYEAIDVEPERFADTVGELAGRGFAGVNVTIPHKLRALELATRASDTARAVGAANTLRLGPEERFADNTDVAGFLAALRGQAPEAPAGLRALVLGAGGAARAVVYALLAEGAAVVEVWNRHPERAAELVVDLEPHASSTALRASATPEPQAADLIVNATSVGMRHPHESAGTLASFKDLPLVADVLGNWQVMVDLVYRDDETALAQAARARGVRFVDGLEVLVQQGAASFELWTGRPAPLEAMRDGARRGYKRSE